MLQYLSSSPYCGHETESISSRSEATASMTLDRVLLPYLEIAKNLNSDNHSYSQSVDADPEKSLTIINEMIEREKPKIIVGTSLGGWMTLMCDSGDAQLVVVNPSTYPQQTLSKWIGQELPYFCERLDGVQTYTLTHEILNKYAGYDIVKNIQEKSGRLHALCSSADDLIGDIHIRTLQPLLPSNRLTVTNDFGHRCSGSGMSYLFNILNALQKGSC